MDSETERETEETKQRRRVKRRVDTIVVLVEITRGERETESNEWKRNSNREVSNQFRNEPGYTGRNSKLILISVWF